jgi:hypothetical protein
MVAEGARLIGCCCGTNPRTVAAISKAIAELKPVKATAVTGMPLLDRRGASGPLRITVAQTKANV